MKADTREELEKVFVMIDAFVEAGIAKYFTTDIQPIESLEERLAENTEHIQNLKAQAVNLKYNVEQWAKAYDKAKDGE